MIRDRCAATIMDRGGATPTGIERGPVVLLGFQIRTGENNATRFSAAPRDKLLSSPRRRQIGPA